MKGKNIETELGRLIFMLSNNIIKTRNQHLKELDLTAGQADALHFFIQNDKATVTDLKEYLHITHQTANGTVRRMAEKGLLQLTRSKKDARCQIVTPTAAGIQLEEQIAKNRERTGSVLMDHMSSDEKKQFMRLLALAFENTKIAQKETKKDEA